jgi:hypothetical protein
MALFPSSAAARLLCASAAALTAAALHPRGAGAVRVGSDGSAGPCVPPGQCTPPATTFSRVIAGPSPGQQWNTAGGFCGAFSVQHGALAFGAWISQDLVRKANRDQDIPHHMHGDPTVGYEVMPSNVEYTAQKLRLRYSLWDSSQPSPQAPAYKRWLKAHLAAGHPIAWFPICKGDSHVCYPDSCPNGGACDHVEPMFGLFSNHALDDPTVYDDDWVLHASDQDLMPYYRPLNSLDDSLAMNGNCKNAGAGFGKNEMYPCFDASVTYGLAVLGLDVNGTKQSPLFPVSVSTPGSAGEPNVRAGQPAVPLLATLTVTGLTSGSSYVLYRYNGTALLPQGPPFSAGAESATPFTAKGASESLADPTPFMSDTAVYWLATTA